MSYNQPSRGALYNRENSLPSYEEAVANVHHSPTTIHEQPTVRYDRQPDYQYAQPAGSQVAEISSSIQIVHVQSNASASRANQIAVEESRRAAARERRNNKWKGSICIVVLIIMGFLVLYYMYFGYTTAKRTGNYCARKSECENREFSN